MESESQVETASLLAKQDSGIPALPSHDDNIDSDLVNETNDSAEIGTKIDETNNNIFTSSINGDNNSNINSTFTTSNNGSYVNDEEEEFETPLDDPDDKIFERPSGDGEIDAPSSGSSTGLSAIEGSNKGFPVDKVTKDEHDDENEVFSREEDSGEVKDGMDIAVEEGSRVRVFTEEEEKRESEDEAFEEVKEEQSDLGDEGGEEKREGNSGEAKEVGGGQGVGLNVEETAALVSTNVDNGGVESVNEGDAVVDSINVDVGEVVRSGVVVDGDEEEKDSNESVEIGDREEKVVSEVEGKEQQTSVAEESSLEDSVNGDAVVDSIQIDAGEAVRSRAAVVGDVEENKGSESSGTELGNTLIEDSNLEVEVEPAEVDSKPGEVKATSEVDSVVDGGSDASVPEKEVKEEAATVGENVTLVNESEPLFHETSSKIVDGTGKEAIVDTEEIKSEVDESKNHKPVDGVQISSRENGEEADEIHVPQEEFDDGDSSGYGEAASRDFAEELALVDHSEIIDGQVVTDSEEEADSDEEGEGRGLIDSAALAALLKAAASAGGSDPSTVTITSQDGSRLFSVERPAGLGTSLRSMRPPSSSINSSIFAPSNVVSQESFSEEDKKKLQKIHDLRVKFLRLIQRLGQMTNQSVPAHVLNKLADLTGGKLNAFFSPDNAKQTATQLEAEGKDDLDFSLNILVLGKTGVGKSATVNSIFGEEKVKINAFEPETAAVNLVSGIMDGVKLRVIDAPGLKTSASEQGFNRKVLASVKKYTKKFPPDLMLYVDRLDSRTRDLNDIPTLRTITSSLGTSIWRSAIVTLTHAACAPPDGPSGAPLGYEVFVGHRRNIIQQSIGQAIGDLRITHLSMMNPVSLVENHPACRKNREEQKVLPNGQAWRPQLLMLCYSLKIIAEASLSSKPQDSVDHRKLFGFRVRSPPLPYLLTSLLQPRTHPKLSADQGGDNGDSDIDLDDLSDTDQEEEDEYDQLPPFKPLRKTQIAKLSREQRKAYFDEYDYRVKLLQKKQWREELKRMRDMKNGKRSLDDPSEMPEDYDGENGAPAAVPVPLPDMVLPPSFDSDSPAYRYRFLEPTSQFLARPVLDNHGWDHDCGYDGVNVEQNLGIAGRYPTAVTVQVTKDKKDFNIHLDSAVSAKHGDKGSSVVGFDIQTIGKQLAYIVRGESKFKTLKKNKTTGGVSVTFLGENVATGVKLEDQIALGKRLVLVGTTGTVRSQKDVAYGANLEVRLKDADYPIGQDHSSFVVSLMKWRGDLAIGGNMQSQISVGRSSKMVVRLALNNKQSGQITVKTSSSDHLALAYIGVIPIALAIYRKFCENYSIY